MAGNLGGNNHLQKQTMKIKEGEAPLGRVNHDWRVQRFDGSDLVATRADGIEVVVDPAEVYSERKPRNFGRRRHNLGRY